MNAQRRFRHGDPVGPLARTPEQWKAWALTIGQRPFRGTQIFQWLHARQQLDPDGMTDVPKAVRALLKTELEQHVPTLERVHEAADGTRKLVLRLTDHSAVESVLIPMDAEDKGEDDTELEDEQDQACAQKQRVTECVSTQAGCAMGCVFCASGHPGLLRHLTPDEIIAQVLIGRALLKPSQRLS
ncbi:MAG TPA: 23S rRNA (adenine(2503)-C(2))-methyltransferase RlmN, partial [Polyangiaceae bacterium]|nr:23S rRNA (adenine(2503)-C(2))-methyltransferase RlmN [Polyangiaceae bacterium]